MESRKSPSFTRVKGKTMSMLGWIVVIAVLILLFGGGGGYYWSRRRV
jgi:hypothetical protein